MLSISFRTRGVVHLMSLTNTALTATLYVWLRDPRNGKLSSSESARKVTPEQAEITRLRADLARS